MAALSDTLISQWSPKNTFRAQDVSHGSNKKVWWVCSEGHEWEAQVYKRVRGQGCSVCAGRTVLPGVNDLATTHPVLAAQWSGKNELGADQVTSGSHKKAWWRCAEGHEWEAVIYSRTAGRGCPVCSGNMTLAGVNDLATIKPDLVSQWSVLNDKKAFEVSAWSHKKVWWVGECGHKWEAEIASRTAGRGCPVCVGRVALAGFNDLATLHPWLGDFWGEGNPPMGSLTAGSGERLQLVCEKGHMWNPYVYSVVKAVPECPECRGVGFSYIERQIVGRLGERFEVKPQYEIRYNGGKKRMVVDGYFEYEGRSVVFEYDGEYWHRDIIAKDTYKTSVLLEQGYTVIRIRERALPLVPISHENFIQIRWEPSSINNLVDVIYAAAASKDFIV